MQQVHHGQGDGEVALAGHAFRQAQIFGDARFHLLERGVIGQRLLGFQFFQFGFDFALRAAAQGQGGRKRMHENNAVNLLPRIENVFALGFAAAFCVVQIEFFFNKCLDNADTVGV